jgi:hypothetical protein
LQTRENRLGLARHPTQRFRSPDDEQNRKIFLTFLNRALPKFFSIKETKIFLFYLTTGAGIAETLSHPCRAFDHKTFLEPTKPAGILFLII